MRFARSDWDKPLPAAWIYEHLFELTQGVLGDGPGAQQRPLQHALLGGQHFGALPVPQQLWLLLQHIFPLQQLWLLLQH